MFGFVGWSTLYFFPLTFINYFSPIINSYYNLTLLGAISAPISIQFATD
jgi:hypothetical protein